MGKRSAVVELFLGDMGSIQRELRPSTQREDQLTMETKLEQIAVKAVNQLPKSVVREIRTPRSVGTGGGRPPPATRWARRNPRPYRDHGRRSLGTSWALSELWVTPIRCAFLVRTQHETTAIHRSRRKHGGHLAASRSRAAIGASNRFPQ